MPVRFRPIIPKQINAKVFQENFLKAARQMEIDVKAEFEAATSKWKNRPAFRGYVRVDARGILVSVGTQNEIFKYVDEGTVPHIIRPKNAKMLHWVSAGGEDVFAKEVHHPGNKPADITKNITEIWEDGLMYEYFEDALIDAVMQSGHEI